MVRVRGVLFVDSCALVTRGSGPSRGSTGWLMVSPCWRTLCRKSCRRLVVPGRHRSEHDKQRHKELKEDRSVTVLVNKKGSPARWSDDTARTLVYRL